MANVNEKTGNYKGHMRSPKRIIALQGRYVTCTRRSVFPLKEFLDNLSTTKLLIQYIV